MIDLEILPTYGLPELPFGSRREMVEQVLGMPDQISLCAGSEDLHWEFKDLALDVYFGKDENYRMDLLETTHRNTVLWGELIFEMSRKELIGLLSSRNYEVTKEDHKQDRIDWDECQITMYFCGAQLDSVQWSVPFDLDADDWIWPA